MNLVVVESPAKAKTIEKYLGSDYRVLASFGHVRDLPSKNGSVDPDADFAMSWSVDTRSKKRIKDIEDALKNADKLILATDPDREGEAISWHLLELLGKKKALKDKQVERVVFNAITKSSVLDAINNPRKLDQELVDAYLARRALDYLVGFTLSPVLWRKLPGARSAGRVQSVALRLITERETEIEQFNPREYWSVTADMSTASGAFSANLVRLDGDKLDKFSLNDEAKAKDAEAKVKAASLSIQSVEAKPITRNPQPPFTTSTLQQEASRKLGFSATRTMQTAQKLYEGVNIGSETVGLITYMRTDGVSMVGEAISDCRATIASKYGEPYLPGSARVYKSKAKNAQEAHEAIRPTGFSRTPDSLNLSGDEKRLYELIWKRAAASQMASAKLERTTVTVTDARDTLALRATGQVVRFDGFMKLYEATKPKTDEEEDSKVLPPLKQGQDSEAKKVEAEQHFTQPPPRYSEASLVKRMEELGIGRPSTYASILKVLQDRDYVTLDKRRFTPSDKGRLLTAFLEEFFSKYVEYNYTADLEEQLDKISAGNLQWKQMLSDFWNEFSTHVDGTKELRVTHVLDALNIALKTVAFPEKEDGTDPRKCTKCDDGELSLKLGKFGAFVGCSNYPECKFTRPFGAAEGEGTEAEDTELGKHPELGDAIWLKTGRFGPYVELALPADTDPDAKPKPKPKRASLPKGWNWQSIDLEKALQLLSLPREIGKHPEDGEAISAGIGRYGPYVVHQRTFASLGDVQEVWDVGLNRAVTLIEEKKASRGKGRGQTVLKDLGKHPTDDAPVQVLDGRYGPYVKWGKINATIPNGQDPQDINIDMALEYIAIKEAKGSKKKPARKKTAAKKKPTAKKKPAAKKKLAAKKAPAKKKATK
ncbi:DNA topoisomerase 1 [Algimonas ampicilliniresistens]|uniref:DNA topoisomerase 1 n=1 Tax=Algimonas ampicilliniresistens TaxID=1298735 RepID=A0ABQ5V5V1_9PROT|nr:type I DNA topoisomerase [Algimonas ampicilliniresistens]GLQ22894.1 DNA topoisomerase 1 [Algimonas ampicilliniresistens]